MRPFLREPRRDLLRTAGLAIGVFLAVSLAGELVRGPFETFGDWVSWPASRAGRCALALVVACALIANGPGLRRTWLFRRAATLDEEGVDTASTVRNTALLMRREGMSRALVVTHYYHEPRARMLFDRAGVRSFTVPATMSRRLAKEPYFLLREVLAYYHSFLLE